MAEAQVLEKRDLEKHKSLRMSVDAVRYHHEKVKRLARGREMHRRKAIHDLGMALWCMCMGVNEMSVWMDTQGYFPPFFSVCNEIGPAWPSCQDYARLPRCKGSFVSLESAEWPEML